MTSVTNKHTGMLNVAGTDIRPGATVEIKDDVFKKWTNGNAAKQWLKAGVVVADTKVDLKKDETPDDTLTERQRLEGRAAALGIDYTAETSDDDLLNAIVEQEELNGKNERDALLTEARSLGLNPNANTGTEKLKKMIADKRAQG